MAGKIFGIIGAMECEVTLLVQKLVGSKIHKRFGLIFHTGICGGQQVVVVKCGVGKVNAARCAQILVDHFNVTHILNTGCAGGVGEGLAVGDVVIASALCQSDFDLSPLGRVPGSLDESPDPKKPTFFQADPKMCAALKDAVGRIKKPEQIHSGVIASGDAFVSSLEKKRFLRENFNAICAEMEGGAIAQVASACRVPFAVLRAVSDLADGTAPDSFVDFAARVSADAVIIVMEFLAIQR